MADQKTPQVTVYSTTWCGFCKMAKAYLTSLKVPFKEVNIEEDQTAAMYIVHKTGQAGVPVIEVADETILGFDRTRLDSALRDKKLIK
jgi:glutaredoxin 3